MVRVMIKNFWLGLGPEVDVRGWGQMPHIQPATCRRADDAFLGCCAADLRVDTCTVIASQAESMATIGACSRLHAGDGGNRPCTAKNLRGRRHHSRPLRRLKCNFFAVGAIQYSYTDLLFY